MYVAFSDSLKLFTVCGEVTTEDFCCIIQDIRMGHEKSILS